MKIYILIKPWDYTIAEVEVFQSRREAQLVLNHAKGDGENNAEHWYIKEVTL